ncbi:uncharacterized protein LOC102607212 isoform X7 [Citrus sinensis]|uniref:uncharacterized protein LOC102607212 isoform X7 n=1 Tax=Citrus sinensis TaxID=2711 RepID=UPI002277BDE7|nr:uncharacterized protein LOC102607212 isoform X7 [Citrus sinensis]
MASRKKRGISMDGILWQQAESQRRASSSRLLTHVDEEDDSTQARQARGPALGVAQWGSGKIMHLDFNSEWQVIGPNSNKFKTQLGIIARNGHKVPLTYVEWIDMPENILKDIWKEVKDNTDAPDAYKSHCLRNIGKLWKNWKSRLKCDHYNNKTYVERIAFTPPRVVAEQWRTLVAYWGTEEAKATAEKNKTNRAQVSSVHRTGRTSFAIKREQQTEAVRDQVFTEVMGPDGHGYVRTYGHGPSPADLLRENSRLNYELVKEELSRLQSNYDDLQCKYTDLQRKYDEMYSFMQRYFDGFAAEIHTSASEQGSDASSTQHLQHVDADAETDDDL